MSRGGRFLVRQRPGPPLEGLWEFPGGKSEPGESPRAATARECREELGFDVIVDERPRRVVARGRLVVHFHDAQPVEADAEPADGSGFRWVDAADLPSLRFPEANGEVVAELADTRTDRAG